MLFGKKRGRQDFLGADKICPNMYVSEDLMSFSFERRNLFTAREITHLRVLFDRDNVYNNLLRKNSWVAKFLPNRKIPQGIDAGLIRVNKIISALDRFFFAAQFIYMSGTITTEEVRIGIARFHPRDKMETILELYKERCKRYLHFRDTFDTHDTLDTFFTDTPGY